KEPIKIRSKAMSTDNELIQGAVDMVYQKTLTSYIDACTLKYYGCISGRDWQTFVNKFSKARSEDE
ncbi:MAG: hypothetical protein IKP58_15775, partial [Victivallales bacterium]|nr:hypothetical protein [Victivallales bacterium]